jgi:mono/diheme cytochrome c family protein
MMKKIFFTISTAALLILGINTAMAGPDAGAIFKSKCAMCHDLEKKKMGPAIKAMNKDAAVLKEMITNGLKMMPKFGKKLSSEEIDAIVAFIQSKQ